MSWQLQSSSEIFFKLENAQLEDRLNLLVRFGGLGVLGWLEWHSRLPVSSGREQFLRTSGSSSFSLGSSKGSASASCNLPSSVVASARTSAEASFSASVEQLSCILIIKVLGLIAQGGDGGHPDLRVFRAGCLTQGLQVHAPPQRTVPSWPCQVASLCFGG